MNRLIFLLCFLGLFAANAQAEPPKIKVLIIDGQNNHQWKETTPLLEAILVRAGIFSVDVSTTPAGAPKIPALRKESTPEEQAAHGEVVKNAAAVEQVRQSDHAPLWAKWRPQFRNYDVVVSNYNGEDWPEDVRTALVAFVKGGGGFVCYHAANNAFPRWPEYNEMIGLGGWGGRTEKSGPYLKLKDGQWSSMQLDGPSGNHGKRAGFIVENVAPSHPIMTGLPAQWLHPQDELYNSLRGPAKNLTVLASAVSDITHEPQPMLMAINFGKGRVFHTTLGHGAEALGGLGFQITFARGAEWAATGKVTLPAPGALTSERDVAE